ncbi:MAG: aldo/keto reductase [uncultured bacterium]|nr:MAG: aldo/keto reductase [uncultured bacterium]HLD45177.1 aldo/keto reductase [bacterium]
MKKSNFPNHQKFSSIQNIPLLGVGTIWFGRRWPAANQNWQMPSGEEIQGYMSAAYECGVRMFDTAAAYGLSEKKLGEFFNNNPHILKESFVSTKWGEDFSLTTEQSRIDHSAQNLIHSFDQSLTMLPRINLLYIHQATEAVLADARVKNKMQEYQRTGKIKFTGASISDVTVLENVLERNLIWFDFMQTSAQVVFENPQLVQKIFDKGIAVVVNSPARKSATKTPEQAYKNLATLDCVSVILTGTRTHLKETAEYFEME